MKKKMISFVMVVFMLLTINAPAFASTVPTNSSSGSGIHILYVNTDDAKSTLNFSGTLASCSGVVDGKTGTTKITATVLLKRVNSNGTTTVKTWSGLSTTSESLYFDSSYYVASGYTYELEIDAKVYRNGTVESISVTDSDYCG